MTREETIKLLTQYIDYDAETPDYYKMEEACKVAIKALEQEPCDCISRKAVIEHYNSGEILQCNHVSRNNLLNYIEGLPSIQPTTKENLVVGDCMKREFIEIVVNYPPADLCTYPEYKGKPYYSILYRDEDSRNHVGFGTYKIEMLSQWIKQYFMSDIQPKTGHWIATEKDWWKCSECGQVIYSETEQDRREYHAYCGRCGAKMLPTDSEKE